MTTWQESEMKDLYYRVLRHGREWTSAWHGRLWNVRTLRVLDWCSSLNAASRGLKYKAKFKHLEPFALIRRETLTRVEFLFLFSCTYFRNHDVIVPLKARADGGHDDASSDYEEDRRRVHAVAEYKDKYNA